jgi:hypothetical protein
MQTSLLRLIPGTWVAGRRVGIAKPINYKAAGPLPRVRGQT